MEEAAAEWLGQADWLVPPLVVAVSALVALMTRRFRQSTAGPAMAGAFLLAVFLMICCEWRGIPVLQFSYYASYLIPPMFLALGALLERPLELLPGAGAVSIACAVLLITTIPLWGYSPILGQLRAETWPAIPLLLGAVFASGALLPPKAAGWTMAAALAGCVVSAAGGYGFSHGHAGRDSFVRISHAADAIDAVRGNEFVWFWYSGTDPHFDEFHALNSIYLWGYSLIGNQFPAIQPGVSITDGALIVIPSSSGEVFSCANQALYSRIFRMEPVARREISEGGVSYSLWFARTRFDSSRLDPQQLRPCESGDCSALAEAESASAALPLAGWMLSSDAHTRSKSAGGISMTTPQDRQRYASRFGPLLAESAGRYLFKLQYRLENGGISFGAKSLDESRWLEQAHIPVSQPGERTAVLSLEAAAGETFWLMIGNRHPLGDYPSRVTIQGLEAYRLPAETMPSRTGPTKR